MKKIEHKIHVQIPQKLERILLYAGGILMVLLVYVFVFQNLQLKNQDLGIKVSKLQTEHTQLLDMKNNQKAHASDTKEMQGQIDKLLKKYPADAKEEDAIMFAKNLEDKNEIYVSDISFAGKNLVKQGESSGYVMYATPVEYTYESGYTDLKKTVSAILKAGDKKNVENITIAYDTETGKLQGTMTVNEFSLQGDDREYDPTNIKDVETGNQNPFATAD